ncbi:MAG: transposase [Nitrospiraceae bacterium]|nr:transposase [Nitrospiraceae bacterium]
MIRKLSRWRRDAQQGATVAELSRSFGITETTWYPWKYTYGGMKATDAKRLKELEAENRRLKTIVADLTLDNTILGEIAVGKV